MNFINYNSTVINQGYINSIDPEQNKKEMISLDSDIRLVNGELPSHEFLLKVWTAVGPFLDLSKFLDKEEVLITTDGKNTAISSGKNSLAVAGGIVDGSVILNVGEKISKKKKQKEKVVYSPTVVEGVEEEDCSSSDYESPKLEEEENINPEEVEDNSEEEPASSDEDNNSDDVDAPYSNPTLNEVVSQISSDIDSKGWSKFFTYLQKKKKECINSISEKLEQDAKDGIEIYPPPEEIFTALELCPLEETKVLIIGQDPYHSPGAAMGVAFSVKEGQKIQPSLRNIFKELKKDGYSHIQGNGDLSDWAVQGVLMINTAFTVQRGNANSYSKEWKTFTKYLMNYINKKVEHLVIVMWGNHAQSYREYFDESRHKFIESAHPSPLSASGGFFGSKPFSKVNKYLRTLGQDEVDWNLE